VIVVARHGRTAWNAEGRFQGWADVSLDAEGRRQSEHLAGRVASLLEAIVAPSTLVTSDLRRAVETAAAVQVTIGVEPAITPELREVDVGAWEGLTDTEAMETFSVEYRRWRAGADIRRGGGETLAEAGARVADALERLVAAAPGPVVVVGHGRSLQAGLDRLAAQRVIHLPGPAPHLGNAECLVLPDWRHDQVERLLSHG
jgi:probable phosphoglycerate mutase